MALYLFRCPHCGPFERFRPMRDVERRTPCPGCGTEALRAYTVPGVRSSTPISRRAIEGAEATREAPKVVTSVPAAAPRPVRFDPRTGYAPQPARRSSSGRFQPLPKG